MKVKITDEALAEVEDLPGAIQERVLSVMERLQKWPAVSGAKALTGNWSGHLRIRTEDYRVVFQVGPERLVVVRVAHRSRVYD